MSENPAKINADAPVAQSDGEYAELDDMEFLDDIDFSLEEVESRIAPLALACV